MHFCAHLTGQYTGTVYGDQGTLLHSNESMVYGDRIWGQRHVFVCSITDCFMRHWKIFFVDFLAWIDMDWIQVIQQSYDKRCFNTWHYNLDYDITIGTMPWNQNWTAGSHTLYTHIVHMHGFLWLEQANSNGKTMLHICCNSMHQSSFCKAMSIHTIHDIIVLNAMESKDASMFGAIHMKMMNMLQYPTPRFAQVNTLITAKMAVAVNE